MCSVIIVHILESICFLEVQLVSYAICVNALMIVEVVWSSLYNSFLSHNETLNDFFAFVSSQFILILLLKVFLTVYKVFAEAGEYFNDHSSDFWFTAS